MSRESIKHYNSIDILRLVCAFLVVLIHMGYGNNAAIIPCLSRQAVPFFFLVSGFFFAKKMRNTGNASGFVRKYARTLIAAYAVWILFWLPAVLHETIAAHPDESGIYLAFVVLRRILLAGIAPYWYLLVLFEGSIVLAAIMRSNRYWIGWILCIGGLILNVVYCMNFGDVFSNIIHGFFYTVFSWECNVIMCGFPMLFIGMAFSRCEERLRSWNLSIIIPLYLLTVLFAFILHGSSKDLYGLPFGIIEALILFVLCVASSRLSDGIPGSVCLFLRNLSSVIFLTHTVFLTILGNGLHLWNEPLRFLITIICCLVLLIAVSSIRWKPLQELFMIKTKSR